MDLGEQEFVITATDRAGNIERKVTFTVVTSLTDLRPWWRFADEDRISGKTATRLTVLFSLVEGVK